jgi:phosphoenolpyruvate carboxylase
LGELLGEMLRTFEGPALLDRVEEVRAIAKRAHSADRSAFGELASRLADLPLEAAVPVARAFATFLTLANIAEQHHRIRRRRDYAREGSRPQPGSCADAFARWRTTGMPNDVLAESVRSLRIELVLTAHPTEVVRRTLLQSHHRIADALAALDRTDLTPEESADTVSALRREIATLWQTEEQADRPVTPLDEVRGGLAVFEQTLWDALPRFVRQVDAALGAPLPVPTAKFIGRHSS